MLVLVSQLIEVCFGVLKHKLESIIAVLLLCLPTFCAAHTTMDGSDSQVAQAESSVLVLVDEEDSPAGTTPVEQETVARESTLVTNASSGNATFTARPMSPAPSPPQDLVVPSDPTESNFTRPFTNELRGDSVSPAKMESPDQDPLIQPRSQNEGREAKGTFASNNSSFQDQPMAGRPGFQPPGRPQSFGQGFRQPPVANPTQFGQGNRPAVQPGQTTEPFSTQAPALSNRLDSALPVTDKPSAWRDAPPSNGGMQNSGSPGLSPMTNQPSSVRSFNTQPGLGASSLIRTANAQSSPYAAQASGQLTDRDSSVQPIGYLQPEPELTTSLAKMLIARYSADNPTDALPGRPVKLIEILREPIPVQQRRAMVNQYWDTYYDWANLVSSQEHVTWLKRISAQSPSEKALLVATIAAAENTTLAAEIQLGKSQSGLAQYMPNWQSSDLLPLPNDLPLIHPYKTNYERFRSRRMMPVSLQGIDQMLPKTLELIMKRAEVVKFSKLAADQVLAGQPGLTTALEAGRLKRSAERDLVASVVSYNQAIGDYSLSVTGGNQSPEDVIAMLFVRPSAAVAQATSILNQPPRKQPARFDSGAASKGSFGGQSRPPVQVNSEIRSNGSSVFNLESKGVPKANTPVFGGGTENGSRAGAFPSQRTTPPAGNFGGMRGASGSNNGFSPAVPGK